MEQTRHVKAVAALEGKVKESEEGIKKIGEGMDVKEWSLIIIFRYKPLTL